MDHKRVSHPLHIRIAIRNGNALLALGSVICGTHCPCSGLIFHLLGKGPFEWRRRLSSRHFLVENLFGEHVQDLWVTDSR